MKKMMKIFTAITVLISTVLATNTFVFATDFSDEAYWSSFCSGWIQADQVAVCNEYAAYLRNKANELEDSLADIDAKISEVKGDLEALTAYANELKAQIEALEVEIEAKQNVIDEAQKTIEALEKEIVEKEEDIRIRDEQIKERMVSTQTMNRMFGYLDFIAGATDFIDLIRRLSVMTQITAYEQDQIRLLHEDIEQLNSDKAQIVQKKEAIIAEKAIIESQKSEVEAVQERQNILIAEYKQKEAELMEAYLNSQETIDYIRNNMPVFSVGDGDIGDNNGAFGQVVTGYKSAGTWYYPTSFGGGRHPGLDIAGPRGTPIYSPFNGVVVLARDGVTNEGLGTYPLEGNNVMVVGEVNGTTYAFHMLHMQYGSVAVSAGQVVSKGQQIGARGSTGNSTGPHVHIDVYNLGSMGVEAAYNYVRNTGSYTFGIPYNAYGYECENKSAPCKARPELILGW